MISEAVSAQEQVVKSGWQMSTEQAAAAAMVAQDRQQGLKLTSPDGPLTLFTKNVLETALNEE